MLASNRNQLYFFMENEKLPLVTRQETTKSLQVRFDCGIWQGIWFNMNIKETTKKIVFAMTAYENFSLDNALDWH